jgi:2-polyprenyl-3-methyl-5-hydroxy-6-metoxy-1,4-benzoquinol methylase
MKAVSGSLAEWRAAAAEASGGTSEDALYRVALAWLEAQHLGGCVLDYGAGAGGLSALLCASGRFDAIVAADLMRRPARLPDAVEWLSQDLNHALAFAEAGFDALFSIEVIEHLENPRAVARDWFRLLKPGGACSSPRPMRIPGVRS